MQLAIDFGNTHAKAAIFNGNILVHYYHTIEYFELIKLSNTYIDAPIMLCSVNQEATHIVNLIENKSRLTRLDFNTPIPITNLYQTPQTLGMDRLAAVIGANYLFPNQNCLVIDAGTCLKYDYVDKIGQYLGGSISLGINMRFKALQHYTSKLPLISTQLDVKAELLGQTTYDAILSGVFNGIKNEVEGIIESYTSRFENLKVLMCGGDYTFFESRIKHPIFAHPELVLLGLNRIILHNAH